MSEPIRIGLRGDGRVVQLTPQTVRAAFFKVIQANRCMTSHLHRFEIHAQETGQRNPLAPLFGRDKSRRLTSAEIRHLEWQINHCLIDHDWMLVDGEGEIRPATVPRRGATRNLRRAEAVVRCGMIFELSRLSRAELFRGGRRDLFLERAERQLPFVRYDGVKADPQGRGLLIQWRNRFRLDQSWTEPQATLDARRLFAVTRVAPCPGFQLCGLIPFADGRG